MPKSEMNHPELISVSLRPIEAHAPLIDVALPLQAHFVDLRAPAAGCRVEMPSESSWSRESRPMGNREYYSPIPSPGRATMLRVGIVEM